MVDRVTMPQDGAEPAYQHGNLDGILRRPDRELHKGYHQGRKHRFTYVDEDNAKSKYESLGPERVGTACISTAHGADIDVAQPAKNDTA